MPINQSINTIVSTDTTTRANLRKIRLAVPDILDPEPKLEIIPNSEKKVSISYFASWALQLLFKFSLLHNICRAKIREVHFQDGELGGQVEVAWEYLNPLFLQIDWQPGPLNANHVFVCPRAWQGKAIISCITSSSALRRQKTRDGRRP
jgi:hypothetical protein